MCFEVLTADAVHIREQSKIDAARVVQAARNELKAASATNNRWVQSYSNQRRVKAAGKQADEIAANIGRNLDAATYGRIGERLAVSEELGANVAAAAAAGVGGSVVDTFNNTIRLSAAMAEEQGNRAVATDLFAATESRANLLEDAYASQDQETFSAGLDYSQFVDHKAMSGLDKVITVVGTAAATHFGGPEAGKAVSDMMAAKHMAENGDFDGASMKAAAAFQGGVAGAKRYSDAGGESYGGRLWDSVRRRAGPRLQIGG